MKYKFILLPISGFILAASGCGSKTGSGSAPTAVKQETSAPKEYHTSSNAYHDLRSLAFSITPEQLQLTLSPEKTVVYGVIMDWGIDTSVATVVAYQTGDASLYLSSGGGFIGGGPRPQVNSAAKAVVSLAQSYLHKAVRSETGSLPRQDEIKFYLLTNKGIFSGQDRLGNFENKTSGWLSLFEEENRLVTELRLANNRQSN